MVMNDLTTPNASINDDEKLISFLIALGMEKRLLLALFAVMLGISAGITFLWPGQYTSTLIFLPPQQQNSSSQAMAQLSALAGTGVAGPLKSTDELYLALLKVRGVSEGVINKLELEGRYAVTSKQQALKILENRTTLSLDKKTGLVSISTRDHDAQFAAALAQEYFTQLKKIISTLAITEAQQRRKYFENQVDKSKTTLAQSEARFMGAQEASGFVVPQALAESGIKEGARIKSEIASREVKLASLRSYATDRNPEVDRIASELSALHKQLDRLESGEQINGKAKSSRTSEGESIAAQAYRDMKVQEAILETMIKQLEIAKADESREGPQLQLVDPPVAAEFPNYPKRALIMLGGFLISMATSLSLVSIKIKLSGTKSSKYTRALINAWLR